MKIVVGGQIDKQKVYDTIKGVVGDRASVEIKDDIAAAMAVKTGQADYYFGACKTGGGGALAMAIALLGTGQGRQEGIRLYGSAHRKGRADHSQGSGLLIRIVK